MEGTDNELIQAFAHAEKTIEQQSIRRDLIEIELRKRMDAKGATVLPHPEYDAEIKTTFGYDYSKLAMLRELIDPMDLEGSGAFTPAHKETTVVDVPDTWNMTKANVFKKQGDNIKAVIDNAQFPKSKRLSIKPKAAKK